MYPIIDPSKKLAICSDHAGFELKQQVIAYLESLGIATHDFGTFSADSCDYPDFAHPCAEAVQSGKDYPGIALCGSGNGMAMVLNKHRGIRAALCWDVELARLARAHNDANILVLPARFINANKALAIVETFFSTPFDGGRHEKRVDKIDCD